MNNKKIGLLSLSAIAAITSGLVSSCSVKINGEEITDNSSQIANPWTNYASLEEAANAVGFDFNIPSTLLNDYKLTTIQGEETYIIEVTYLKESDNKEITIRKGVGNQDISGDFNTYLNVKEITINSYTVTIKGNEDNLIKLANWNNGDYNYCLYVDNLTLEEVTSIINVIK